MVVASVRVGTIRVALVRCLNRNPTLLQTAEDAECNICWNLVFELLDTLAIQSLDSKVGLHEFWINLEQSLSSLLDSGVFGVEA
jgi:hypothetical protein